MLFIQRLLFKIAELLNNPFYQKIASLSLFNKDLEDKNNELVNNNAILVDIYNDCKEQLAEYEERVLQLELDIDELEKEVELLIEKNKQLVLEKTELTNKYKQDIEKSIQLFKGFCTDLSYLQNKLQSDITRK